MRTMVLCGLVISAFAHTMVLAEDAGGAKRAFATLIDVDHVNFALTEDSGVLECDGPHMYSKCVYSVPVSVIVDGDKADKSGSYVYSWSKHLGLHHEQDLKELGFRRLTDRLNDIKTKCLGDQFKLVVNDDDVQFQSEDIQAYARCKIHKVGSKVTAFKQTGQVWATNAVVGAVAGTMVLTDAASSAQQAVQDRVQTEAANLRERKEELVERARKRAGSVLKNLGNKIDNSDDGAGDQD